MVRGMEGWMDGMASGSVVLLKLIRAAVGRMDGWTN